MDNCNEVLYKASRLGNLELVKLCIKYNKFADINRGLRYASKNGHLELVKYFVEKCGCDIEHVDKKKLSTEVLNII